MTKQEIIKNILAFAVKAPSAHNTQPWLFDARDNEIDVYADKTRHLSVSDPDKRQIYISLGCAIANIELAANHNGYNTEITYCPEGEDEDRLAAKITLTIGEVSETLFDSIDKRKTDRSIYTNNPLDVELKETDKQEVILITDRNIINELADITGKGSYETLARKDFKEELSHWVRSNWSKKKDGMPAYAMGLPAIISPFISTIVRIVPIHKQEKTNTAKQMRSASAVVVIATPEDSFKQWLKAGYLLERVWLEAVSKGLAGAPLAAAIEAGEEYRRQTKHVLSTSLLPQAVLRIGYSKKKNLRSAPYRNAKNCLK